MDIGAKEFLTQLMRGYNGYDFYYLEEYYREFNIRNIDDEFKERAIRSEVLSPTLLYKEGMVYIDEFTSVRQVDKNLRYKQFERTFKLYARCVKRLGDEIRRIERGYNVFVLEFIRLQSSNPESNDKYLALCRDRKRDIYYIAIAKLDYITNGLIDINIIRKPYNNILSMREKVNKIIYLQLLKVLEVYRADNRECSLLDYGVNDMTITPPIKNYVCNGYICNCDTSNINDYERMKNRLKERLMLFVSFDD